MDGVEIVVLDMGITITRDAILNAAPCAGNNCFCVRVMLRSVCSDAILRHGGDTWHI